MAQILLCTKYPSLNAEYNVRGGNNFETCQKVLENWTQITKCVISKQLELSKLKIIIE